MTSAEFDAEFWKVVAHILLEEGNMNVGDGKIWATDSHSQCILITGEPDHVTIIRSAMQRLDADPIMYRSDNPVKLWAEAIRKVKL